MHSSSDSRQKAASELHWSRLVTPIRSRKRFYLNGLAGFGHAVPSKRSSPPAEKWAVCIGGSPRSQGKESRWFAAFSAFAGVQAAAHPGRRAIAGVGAASVWPPLRAERNPAWRRQLVVKGSSSGRLAGWCLRRPASPAARPRDAPDCRRRPCLAPALAVDRPRAPSRLPARRCDRNYADWTTGERWQ